MKMMAATHSVFGLCWKNMYMNIQGASAQAHVLTTSSPCLACVCQVAMLTRPGAMQLILMLWGAYVAEAPVVRPATAPFAAAMASWFATPVCATAQSSPQSEPL